MFHKLDTESIRIQKGACLGVSAGACLGLLVWPRRAAVLEDTSLQFWTVCLRSDLQGQAVRDRVRSDTSSVQLGETMLKLLRPENPRGSRNATRSSRSLTASDGSTPASRPILKRYLDPVRTCDNSPVRANGTATHPPQTSPNSKSQQT